MCTEKTKTVNVQAEQNLTASQNKEQTYVLHPLEDVITEGEVTAQRDERSIELAAYARTMAPLDDGQAAPPAAEPVPVSAEEREHKSKKERQAEMEYEQQQAVEEQVDPIELQRQREREEAQRAMDEERMQNRKLLFEDHDFIQALGMAVQEKDKTIQLEKLEYFLLVAGQRMLDLSEGVREGYGATVTDTAPLCDNMKRLVLMTNPSSAMELVAECERVKGNFEDFETRKARARVISQIIPEILNEEFTAMPELTGVMDKILTDLQNESDVHIREFTDVQRLIESETGLNVKEAMSNPAYQYLKQDSFKQKLEHDIIQEIDSSPELLNRDEAELRVFARYREEKRAEAKSLSGGNIVPNASEQVQQQYGNALTKRVVPIEEGTKYVHASKGLLYLKPVGEGLVEVRPTIPKEIMIDGKNYPMRKDYLTFIRVISKGLFDDQGNMREDARTLSGDINYYFGPYIISTRFSDKDALRNSLEAGFTEELMDEIKKELGGDEQAEEFKARMKEYFIKTSYGSSSDGRTGDVGGIGMIPREILESVENLVVNRQYLLHTVANITSVKDKLRQDGASEKEIDEYIAGINKMLSDSNASVEEFVALRDLPLDGEEVPLPQACSANAKFYERMTMLVNNGETLGNLRYDIEVYFQDKPDEVFANMEAEIAKRKAAGIDTKDFEKDYERMKLECEGNTISGFPPFSSNSIGLIKQYLTERLKYVEHYAGLVGNIGEDELTVEMFAPETTVFAVSPFSTHCATGKYRKGLEGMEGYYNADKGIASEEKDIVLGRVNSHLKRSNVPGVPPMR